MDFYVSPPVDQVSGGYYVPVLNRELLNSIANGDFQNETMLAVAQELLRVVHQEYENFGTGGSALNEDDIRLAHKTLRLVLVRLGIDFQTPWKDFSSFRTYWIAQGASGAGGWQARRDLLNFFFRPVEDELDRREFELERSELAVPVSPHGKLGWEIVDQRIEALKRRFLSAQTPEDYSDVGNRAVATLEALGDAVYNPQKHVRDGETPLPRDKTKLRFDRYIETSCSGPENASLRKIAKGAVELSHGIKHSSTTPRRNAGIIADSVILLSNIIRRLEQEQ